MKTSDFEKAIDSLSCNIEILEMRMRHGSVTKVYGQTAEQYLKWDNVGRGFCASKRRGESSVSPDELIEIIDRIRGWWRDPVFDLKFD